MKKQFQSNGTSRMPRVWQLLMTMVFLFTLGIGQMWADTEIFSWTATSALAKNASETATGGTVQCTGSAMGSETPSGSGFYKFNSSTQLTFTLSSGTFAAGDVISFTFTSGGKNKTVGVDIQEASTQLTETVAKVGTSVTKTYTVTASDGIQGQNKFSIKRVDSNFSFKSVSVTRASSGSGTGGGEGPSTPSSDATLKALTIDGYSLNETFASATEDYTVTLPFYASAPATSAVHATKNDPKASVGTVTYDSSNKKYSVTVTAENTTTTKTYTISLNWAAVPTTFSSSINIEQSVLDNGVNWNYAAALSTANIAIVDPNALDSLAEGKTARNYGFLGLKFKKATSKVTVVVPSNNVLNVKWGNISTPIKVKVNGVAQSDIATKTNGTSTVYHLDAATSVREVEFYIEVKDKTITLQQVKIGADVDPITLPYLVTYDAGEHGTCAKAKETWTGTALTLPAVTPESGWNFDGWSDGTNIHAAGAFYTPTTNVTMTAQYSAQASPFDLTALTYKIGAGAATNVGYVDGTFTYNIELPYAQYDAITVTPTLKVGTSSLKGDEVLTVSSLPGAATFTVVAANSSEQLYTVNFTRTPKDGVSLVKIVPTSQTKGTQTGLYPNGDELTINLSSGMNLGGSGKYIGVKATENFQEGDVLHLDLNTKPNTTGSTQIILYAEKEATNELWATGELASEAKDYYLTLPAAVNGHKELYIVRTDGNKWNGGPSVMEVTRAMMPEMTAIKIDDRDGEIDALDDKHFSVTIPYESVLTSLTVVPTIIRNAAHATTPEAIISNGGAWIIGDNTYRVMDKDGDYTDYTITLDRDVLKHTVSFNTHGGSAVASALVVDGESLAAAPADPEKEDYIFQGWAETDGGAIVDVTSFAISADKEFHAVWASDGGIKLLDGSTVNHTNFITAVTATETVEFKGNTVNYAKFSGTCGSVNNVKDLTRVIAYNATTNKTKIRISAHNNSTSGRNILVKGLVEGADAAVDLATIALGNKEDKVSDWIEFDNAANRTIYIMVGSSAGDVYFTQVKVIESGETPMKQAGEVGYSLNFNKGRFFGVKSTTAQFEGMSVAIASSDCQPLSSSVVKVKENSMSFTAAAPVLLKVTTANNKTYYVANSTSGTTNETAKTGESEFNLAAGTWFINAGASEVQFTKIEFAMPKAAKPVVADMDNVDYCQGSAIDELAVSASVSDGGTMLYQWYKDGVKIDGAEAATYQPTDDGEYYVVVVNTKADHQNSDATQSNTIAVTGHAGTVISGTTGAEDWPGEAATISVTASGKNLHYAWYTCDDAMGTNPVAVDPAVDAAELNVTIAAADTYYKVVVSGDCGSAQEAIITVVARQAVDLQDVTGDMSWDFSKANDGSAAGSDLCTDEVLANVHGIVNNDDFKSAYLKATANKFKSGKLQASMIKFHTTVDGMITVVFSNTGSKSSDRYLTVNGRKTDKGSKNETAVTYTGFVYAGDVELGVVEGDGNMLNFTSVDFEATTSYTRPVNPSFLGTLCWTNNAVLGGATLYVFAGKNENNYLVFDEVEENRLEAGKPYIFMPENGNTEIKLYNTSDEALTEDQAPVNHMYGTIVGKELVPGVDDNMYYFSSNHIWAVKDFVVNIPVPAYYCYIDYPAVLADEPAPAPAPGRRRVSMGVQGSQVATGFEAIEASEKPMKLMINGQIFILRGEKLFDATGRLVK